MSAPIVVHLFFNFRSPYCYLASKTMFDVLDRYRVKLDFRPLGGWAGRSPPERAKVKVPLTRQDVRRWARRLGIPLEPPPISTDPTRAGRLAFLAMDQGLLRPYVVETMRAEWATGKDIGDPEVLLAVARQVGLDETAAKAAMESPDHEARLEESASFAASVGVIGVPSFVVGEEIFWGNDRISFLEDHLRELRLAKI